MTFVTCAGDESGVGGVPESVQEPLCVRGVQEHRALAYGVHVPGSTCQPEGGWLCPGASSRGHSQTFDSGSQEGAVTYKRVELRDTYEGYAQGKQPDKR